MTDEDASHDIGDDIGDWATIESEDAAERALLARLDALGIGWTHHRHPPLHTVEESRALRGDLSGAHVKNMFLKDRKGGLWLVTCLEHRRIRIRDLGREIGTKDPSFGAPDLLAAALGVRPGAVTPFALMNDPEGRVGFVLDAGIRRHETVNAHPLHNRATIAVSLADLDRFVAATGHAARKVDFDALEALAEAAAAPSGGPTGEAPRLRHPQRFSMSGPTADRMRDAE